MKIIVASENPVKIKAVEKGFRSFFQNVQVEGANIISGVSSQPLSGDETLTGARNRAIEARRLKNDADFWVGIEGGVQPMENALAAFAWIVVCSTVKSGEARTATFFLPQKVSRLIKGGMELGAANDIVFNKSNSKQKNGAVGLLTHNITDRQELYKQAVILALIPFLNPELY